MTSPFRPSSHGAPGPDVVALLDGWAAARHGSLPRRLAASLRTLVDAGLLAPGQRLPPERVLAQRLDVSRTTVTQALDELRGAGMLASSRGSGTYVTGPPSTAPPGTRIVEHLASGPGIDLAKGDAPDLSHLPPIVLEMWQLAAHVGGAAVHPAGLDSLRADVAALYCRGGITGDPRATEREEIHITAGSHQATALLLSALAPRGSTVAVAEWSYAGLFDILDRCELRPAVVALDRHGLVPDSLIQVIEQRRPHVVYVQAGPQIPTGQVASPQRIKALAHVLDAHGDLTVIEDTTVAATTFTGSAPMLADHCRRATVISTGSLSKLCFSGLRIGWIRAPEPIIADTSSRHLGFDLGASVPSQLLARQLLPHLDAIALRRRRTLHDAVTSALAQLAEALPAARIVPPAGNSILWTHLPIPDGNEFVDAARRRGVRIAAADIHHPHRQPSPYVRIDVDRPPAHVREGMIRLADAWSDLGSAGTSTSDPVPTGEQ